MVDAPEVTPLKKTDSPCQSSCQLSIVSHLVMETPELLPLKFFCATTLIDLVLCESWAGKHRCWDFESPAALTFPEDTKILFDDALRSLALTKLSASSHRMVPGCRGEIDDR